MKRFIQCVCLFLVAAMLMTIPAFASESVAPRASLFFGGSGVYLHEVNSVMFEAWFDVTATDIMDELGASKIKIQRSSDGENWTTVNTYTKEDRPNLICENTAFHASCIRYTGTKGYYYRACIILYAKNSTGIGELTRYTSSIYLD